MMLSADDYVVIDADAAMDDDYGLMGVTGGGWWFQLLLGFTSCYPSTALG